MRRDEKGYIVVETIGCFLLFVLLVISILSLINIVTVQTRVHYALTQAAQTVSMYSYVLDITGVADPMKNLAGKAEGVEAQANEMKGNINELIDGINSLAPDRVVSAGESVLDQATGLAKEAAADPKSTIQDLLSYGLNEGGKAAFGELMRPLVGRYLANGSMTGDEFLTSFRVIKGLEGLDFYSFDLPDLGSTGAANSTLLTSGGDVKISVRYSIDYSFGALMLPFEEPKLDITQTVVTKAWLGGRGEGYEEP